MPPAPILAGLFFVALTLRPQIVGVGPLLPEIQDDLETTYALVGLLATIPVLCMGLFAPPAAYLSARIGTRAAITCSILLIGVFGVGRAVAPSAALVVLFTWPVGIGMGIAGAVVPVAVKERFATRPAGPTGVYTMGIQSGSALSAAIAVPLAAWYGGWRASLMVFSVVTLGLAVVWVVLTRRDPMHERRPERPPRPPWDSRVAWLLVALFALMASTYYGINAGLLTRTSSAAGARSQRESARRPQLGRDPGRIRDSVAFGSRVDAAHLARGHGDHIRSRRGRCRDRPRWGVPLGRLCSASRAAACFLSS